MLDQQEIATKRSGVTPQAISQDIRRVHWEEGMASASGRGNYEVTKAWHRVGARQCRVAGVRCLSFGATSSSRSRFWTAIGGREPQGRGPGRGLHEGRLFWTPQKVAAGDWTVVADAQKDEDVGVARFDGTIQHHEGAITISEVPRIQHWGFHAGFNWGTMQGDWTSSWSAAAVGLEAHIALKIAGN